MAALVRLKQQLHQSVDQVFDTAAEKVNKITSQGTQTTSQDRDPIDLEDYKKLKANCDGLEKYCRDLHKAHKSLKELLRLSQKRRKEWERYKSCEHCRREPLEIGSRGNSGEPEPSSESFQSPELPPSIETPINNPLYEEHLSETQDSPECNVGRSGASTEEGANRSLR